MPRTRSRLFRRPDSPFWWAVWTDHQGRLHRQSTGCRDHGSAAAWLSTRELERVKEGAGIPVARPVALLLALAEYVEDRRPEWSAGWTATVESMWRTQVVPHFGEERQVLSIREADASRFRAMQIGRVGRGGKPVSRATVNRLFWALAAFGKWCLKQGYHTENPWAAFDSLAEDQLPPPTVEAAQLERLFAALEQREQSTFPWRALFEFAGETSLRKSELARLEAKDIDRRERRLWVVSAHARGLTKSRKTRSVPLSRRALEILDALPRRNDGLVFGPIPDPRRAFAAAAKAAGLPRVWLHLFRHLGASRFAATGAGQADLIAWGGWSSARMAQRYAHADHRRMLALLDGVAGAHSGHAADPEKEKGDSENPNRPS